MMQMMMMMNMMQGQSNSVFKIFFFEEIRVRKRTTGGCRKWKSRLETG
jgi:hypothetical protein